MMVSRRFIAVSAALLMVLTACIIAVPETDAEGENTFEMRMEVDAEFTRSDSRISFNGWLDENEYLLTELCDDLFQKYIDGESEEFMEKVVKDPQMRSLYYVYSIDSRIYDVHFYRSAPTTLIMPAGETVVRLMTNIDSVDMRIGWDRYGMFYKTDTRVDINRDATAHLHTSTADFNHLKPVTVWFDDSSVIPEKCSPTQEYVLNTNLVWYHDNIRTGNGYVWAEDVYIFRQGSSGEDRFVKEVIEGGRVNFDFSEYGIMETGELPAGNYSVYKAEHSYGWVTDTSYLHLSDAGGFDLPLYKEPPRLYTMFAKPNSTVSVGMTYDDSKFMGYMQVGFEMYQISSGYEYEIDVSYATEVILYLESLNPNQPYTTGEAKIVCDGTETEAGSPTGMAVVCIMLAVLVFALLFVFNRKPHW